MIRIQIVWLGVVSAVATLAFVLPATAHRAAARTIVVTVIAGKPSEFGFDLSTTTISGGPQVVIFKVTNAGILGHDFEVCPSNKGGSANHCVTNLRTAVIRPGHIRRLSVPFFTTGTYEYLCTVPGHAAAGMKGDVTVT